MIADDIRINQFRDQPQDKDDAFERLRDAAYTIEELILDDPDNLKISGYRRDTWQNIVIRIREIVRYKELNSAKVSKPSD